MSLSTFIADQLRKPSGRVGKILTARLLNRANVAMNLLTLQALDLRADDQVLEVGFGGGDLISRMATIVGRGGRVVGVDFSPEMVEVGAKRFAALIQSGSVELCCASVEQLPYDSEQFTKACTVNTIYFWPDPVGALREIRRTLRRRGRLALCFNPRATAGKLPYTRHGFTLYDPDEVERLLSESGFGDIRSVTGSHRLGVSICAIGTKQEA